MRVWAVFLTRLRFNKLLSSIAKPILARLFMLASTAFSTLSPALMRLEELAPHLAKAGGLKERFIGLDLGTKTIGVALSDVERRIATPLITLAKAKFSEDAEALGALCNTHSVCAIILGMPYNMDGSEGRRAQSTKAFARNLLRALEKPIILWDERLSTAAVTRALIAQDASRNQRAKVVDRMAAAYILQGALDRLRQIGA